MITCRKALPCDTDGMVHIWRNCFGDDEDTVRLFLNSGFDSYVAVSNESTVAMLHFMKVEISLKNDIKNGVYLYAAATLPEYRNRGIMSKLIEFAEQDALSNDIKFVCLTPSNEELFTFYKGLGYKDFFKTRFLVKKRAELEKDCKIAGNTTKYSFDIIEKLRFNIYWKRIGSILYPADYIKFGVKMYEHYGARFVCGKSGYLLYRDKDDGSTEILELAAESCEYPELLGKMLAECKSECFTFRLPADSDLFPDEGEVRYTGVIKPFAPLMLDTAEPYMGLVLD